MELVANTARQITITPQGAWTPGTPVYVNQRSIRNKLGGLMALVNKITWTIAGCTASGGFAGGGGGEIQATAQKVKMEGLKPLRLNDEGNCSGSLVNGVGAVITCSCKYKITGAGQSKVKAG